MAVYANDQLSIMIDALTARVNALDGQGLKDPTQSAVTRLDRRITGVKSDLDAAFLQVQQLINQWKRDFTNALTPIKTALGLA